MPQNIACLWKGKKMIPGLITETITSVKNNFQMFSLITHMQKLKRHFYCNFMTKEMLQK